MASEYGAEPEPEVVRLAARLRSQPRPAAVTAVDDDGTKAPKRRRLHLLRGSHPSGEGTTFRRRPRRWTVAVAAAAILLSARALMRSRDSQAPAAEASVAILPFADLSPARDRQFLSDGITEELMGRLQRVQGLRVAARTSSFFFRGREREINEVGRQLGVAAVVIGSVREDGTRLQIVSTLLDARSGAQRWTHSYNVDAAEVFSAQDAIARSVAAALHLKVEGGVDSPLGASTVDPRAHELAMRGRFAWNQRTEESVRAALGDFEEAARIDPRYAVAYAGISDAWQILPQYGHVAPREALANSKTAALRAIALDSTLAEAHTSLAAMLVEYDRDRPGAEREYARAIALNPGYATAHHWYGLHLAADGKFPEATAQIELGRRLDPLSSIISSAAGVVRYFARDYDGAVAEFRAVLALQPDFATAWSLLGRTQCALGQYDDAVRSEERAVELSGRAPANVTLLAYALASSGRARQADSLLRSLTTDSARSFVPAIDLAAVYVVLKRVDDAFRVLQQGYAARDIEMKYLRVDPRFDEVRSDARFARLAGQLGLGGDARTPQNR
ncbi:MAG: tetratricopeptide repeat protein [Gemmatimonadaceae bacterium]